MEHLTAEIVHLIVSDISLAIEWLKCSYLYVRIKKNPENYGIKREIPHQNLEKYMREICVQNINELAEYGMIWTDEDGFLVKPLEPGRLMTKFYLKFATMKSIMESPGSCSLEDALRIIGASEEISWIQLRRNEKKLLNDINLDKGARLRFHVYGENGKKKKRIQTREEKIFVLANDCLTGDPLAHDLSLSQDMNSICISGCRIAKCMKECFIFRRSYKGALSSSLLAKCLHQRLWDDSPYLLKQLAGIGMVTAKALHSAGISTFDTMRQADPRRIELITGRKYPFGNHIKESLLSLPPKVELLIEEIEFKRQGKSKLLIKLTRVSKPITSSKHHYADLLVGSEEDNAILFHEKIRAEEFSSPYVANVLVPCLPHGRITVKADLIFENYVGLDVREKYVISGEVSSVINRAGTNEVRPSNYSIPKEIYIENDYKIRNMLAKTKDRQDLASTESAQISLPSFDLLQGEMNEDSDILEPGETECKTKMDETVFDHIRRKSKAFPDLITLKTTHPSYPSKEQCRLDTHKPREDSVVLIDLDPVEAHTMRNNPEHGLVLIDLEQGDENFSTVTTFHNDQTDRRPKMQLYCENHGNQKGNLSNSIENFTDPSSIMISELAAESKCTLSNLFKKRKLASNWINDGCKMQKYEPDNSSFGAKLEESELHDNSYNVAATAGFKNSLTMGQKFCSGQQDGSRSSCLGTAGGSMEVSFMGFKSVFSFL